MGDPLVSVIVPVLDDTDQLADLLRTWPKGSTQEAQLIVVSGAPPDEAMTALIDARQDVVWLASPPGRGRQMNVGAAAARGRWLLFLHADVRLPPDWLAVIHAADRAPGIVGGSFRLTLDSPTRAARLVEWGVRQRVRWLGMPYGDQALFVRRDVFEALGGYRPLPLMEDVDFVRRLRRYGRLLHSDLPVRVSARRWERCGWVRTSAVNSAVLLLYFAGVPTSALARLYHRLDRSAGRPGALAALTEHRRHPLSEAKPRDVEGSDRTEQGEKNAAARPKL